VASLLKHAVLEVTQNLFHYMYTYHRYITSSDRFYKARTASRRATKYLLVLRTAELSSRSKKIRPRIHSYF
jgi:peptidase E